MEPPLPTPPDQERKLVHHRATDHRRRVELGLRAPQSEPLLVYPRWPKFQEKLRMKRQIAMATAASVEEKPQALLARHALRTVLLLAWRVCLRVMRNEMQHGSAVAVPHQLPRHRVAQRLGARNGRGVRPIEFALQTMRQAEESFCCYQFCTSCIDRLQFLDMLHHLKLPF